MMNWLWIFSCWNYYFNIFREYLWQPKGYVCFLSCFLISKSIHSFNYNHYLLIYLLWTINYLLFFYFWGSNIQPVCEKLSYIFLQKINSLLQFQILFKFDNDLIEWVEVIWVIATIRSKMHDCQNFLFSCVIR